MRRILHITPYDGGSHAQWTRLLSREIEAEWTVLALPGRFWKWRMRGVVPYLHLKHPDVLNQAYDAVLATSYVPLAELRGFAPNLTKCPNYLYFHENQFAYPVRVSREWDNHYAVSQLTSALVADQSLFNSAWNRDSFLDGARQWLRNMPDAHPPGWIDAVAEKCTVYGVPLDLADVEFKPRGNGPPVILWNHRWEFDKAPEVFFEALAALAAEGMDFRVIVCGQRFRNAPESFESGRELLGDRVLHWGYAEDRGAYEDEERQPDDGQECACVSTAHRHLQQLCDGSASGHGSEPWLDWYACFRAFHLRQCGRRA